MSSYLPSAPSLPLSLCRPLSITFGYFLFYSQALLGGAKGQDGKQWAETDAQGIPPRTGVELYCEGELGTGAGCPGGCGASFPGDIPNPSEQGAQGTLPEQRLGWLTCSDPSDLTHSGRLCARWKW